MRERERESKTRETQNPKKELRNKEGAYHQSHFEGLVHSSATETFRMGSGNGPALY